MRDKVLIISPSGKLYGSESVLIDYLSNTRLKPDVLVPKNSDLETKLNTLSTEFKVIPYRPDRLKRVYLKLFFLLLLRKYKTVYINEAGHLKYILFLARVLPHIRFRIHVRLIEDTAPDRWRQVNGNLPHNVGVISISSFIADKIPVCNKMIPDPFIFSDTQSMPVIYNPGETFNIGIIGRITLSKGIGLLPLLVTEIEKQFLENEVKIHLFGEAGIDVPSHMMQSINKSKIIVSHGYVKGATYIYNNLHAVLHLSKVEPLGRIFFESVNYGLPFLGIDAGGIGEIARQYEYQELMISDGSDEIIVKEILEKCRTLMVNYEIYKSDCIKLKMRMNKSMAINNYCHQIDQELNTSNLA